MGQIKPDESTCQSTLKTKKQKSMQGYLGFLQGNSDALGFKLKPTTSFMFAEIIGFADLNSNVKFCTTLISLKLLFLIHNYPSLIKYLRVVKKCTVSAKHTHTHCFSHT